MKKENKEQKSEGELFQRDTEGYFSSNVEDERGQSFQALGKINVKT